MPVSTRKVLVPWRVGDRVTRSRLTDRLDRTRRLTLVSAPAGSGKTTLLIDWVERRPGSVAWLSLDEEDNNVIRFVANLGASVAAVRPEIATTAKRIEAHPDRRPEAMFQAVADLLAEVAALDDPLTLVLDDYHVVREEDVQRVLEHLVANQPPTLHLVVSSRSDPHLPLARLRVQSELNEIREEDLRFTPDEASELLNRVLGLGLSGDNVARLHERTEGWAAGLQLAGLSLRNSDDPAGLIDEFAGDHRYVVDYLVDEVLHTQNDETTAFLLKTSVLEQMTAPLCEAVTGTPGAQLLLESIERANLFLVPLDHQRRWYRYHHLFRDLLRSRLEQRLSREEIQELHRRASAWLADADLPGFAIRHALAADEAHVAARLVRESWRRLLNQGRRFELESLLDGMPSDYIAKHPRLCIGAAWIYTLALRGEEAIRYLRTAEAAIEDLGDATDSESRAIIGEFRALRAFLAVRLGKFREARQEAEASLQFLPANNSADRAVASLQFGLGLLWTDQPESAHRHLQFAADVAIETDDYLTAVAALGAKARLLIMEGKPKEAEDWCRKALETCRRRGWHETPFTGALHGLLGEALADYAHPEGKNAFEAALALLRRQPSAPRGSRLEVQEILEAHLRLLRFNPDSPGTVRAPVPVSPAHRLVPLFGSLAVIQARICFLQGAVTPVRDWLEGEGPFPDAEITAAREGEHLMWARLCLADGDAPAALATLEPVVLAAERSGRTRSEVEALTLRAAARQKQGNSRAARESLDRVLELATSRSLVRPLLEHGASVSSLLKRRQEVAPELVDRILRSLPPPKRSPATLLEPLSVREREVFELVCAGLANREIGERLFVSSNTVKTHIRNIYGKLGVASRSQAIARGRTLRLS